jgi:hypothetical protein
VVGARGAPIAGSAGARAGAEADARGAGRERGGAGAGAALAGPEVRFGPPLKVLASAARGGGG